MSKKFAATGLAEARMPESKAYATPTAFRRALEDRLTAISKSQNIELPRLRRMVAFERLLARLFSREDSPWFLKGGYALEIRFRQDARATRDIDLALPEVRPYLEGREIDRDKLLARLERAAATDLGDWFGFQIGTPTLELEAEPYGGFRFPAVATLDQREFTTFHWL